MTTCESLNRNDPGVAIFVPQWDDVICAGCVRDAGSRGVLELGDGVRAATSDDIRRRGYCGSCGALMSGVLAG